MNKSLSRVLAESKEEQDSKGSGRARKKRQRSAAGGVGLSGYLIGALILLLLWGGLTALALSTSTAAYWLILCGALTFITGVFWLYGCAAADRVERFSFTSVRSRSLILFLFVALVELLFMPVFSVVYLATFFDNAWKPFLIEAFGIAMCATGFLVLFR